MLTEIGNNIYKKAVPLPNNPLREINVYIIKGEKNLVIDTGFNRPECAEAFNSAFKELNIEETDVFITHLHSDHCGLVSSIPAKVGNYYSGEVDGELINFEVGNLYWKMLDDLYLKYGFPKSDFGRNTDIHPGRKYCHERRIDFKYLEEGEKLNYGGHELEAVITPGHTPGHTCLYDRKNKILFCGDHILGDITPNIGIEISQENPLQDYLNSLAKVDKLEVDLLLSSHGIPVDDMHIRIKELYEHHKERLEEVCYLLSGEWTTGYEVASKMTWEIDCNSWNDFPLPQKWFATGEALAHLQYLYFAGEIKRDEIEGIYCYSK